MVQQQPDEFLAGVTGRADDGGFLGIHIRVNCWSNGVMEQWNFATLHFSNTPPPKQKTPPD
jgi:hypothetical protein